mgnify:CR=1 FL=1
MTFSLEEGIEGIAKATETFEVKMEMSTTESYSKTETKTMTVTDTTTDITIQPGECIQLKETLSTLSYNAKYSVQQKVTNYFFVSYPNKVRDHFWWFIPLSKADQTRLTRTASGVI